MRRNMIAVFVVAVSLGMLAPAPAAGQDGPPKTPWGDPDLQGTWSYASLTPLQRPTAMADKDFRENSPLEAAKERQGHIESRIRELESILATVHILGPGSNAVRQRSALGTGDHCGSLSARPICPKISCIAPNGHSQPQNTPRPRRISDTAV